jgi:Tol biopolymer transport system component
MNTKQITTVICILAAGLVSLLISSCGPGQLFGPTLTPTPVPPPTPMGGGGSLIAFERDSDIFVMGLDGSGLTDLTENLQPPARSAKWSPDGKKIAFISTLIANDVILENFYNVYVMNADGTGIKNLTNHMGVDNYPAWSPDGKHIAFASKQDNGWEIFVINADGTNLTNLNQQGSEPSWSPDGAYISFTCDNGICVMKSNGSELKHLTSTDLNAFSSTWSPDGKSIVFSSFSDNQVYIMTSDGLNITKLTNDEGPNWEPTWSPDSKLVVYACNFKICTIKADGTGSPQLIPVDWGRGPSWQP